MANFVVGKPIEWDTPTIEVSVGPATPLPIGTHEFSLVVVDQDGNRSQATSVKVTVRDTQRPTAILKAPETVEYGQPFTLDGSASSDVPPGQIVKWVFTLLN